MMRWFVIGVAIVQSSAAWSQQREVRPALLGDLIACRAITNINQRVTCYDRQVSALDEAERKRDVVLVERSEIRKARRSLFGLPLPKLNIFDGDGDEPEFKRIDVSIRNAQRSGGKWLFELDDGTRWIQSDSEEVARSPKTGNRIRIRRAAVGSFFANIESAPAIRVRRIE